MVYFNSAGNESGRITFDERQILTDSRLVLGFNKSPQYADYSESPYTYGFSSAGLASTAGKIQLFQGAELIDEICWGKLECANPNPKFATKPEENTSLVRCSDQCEGTFIADDYYPNIIESIKTLELPEDVSCNGLIISEIHSYYANSADEQFIELYNHSETEIDLLNCLLVYKNKEYTFEGTLPPGGYYVYRNPNLTLTKDPTTYNYYALKYASGDIFYEVILPHGQKKGTSYAIFYPNNANEQWLRTYAITPGDDNKYQEFQTCEEGKMINPETGNCIKEVVDTETECPDGKYLNPLTGRCKSIPTVKTTTCKEGYYLNPSTGRCKKYNSGDEVKECQEGYERNPETNRCRKIRADISDAYPVAEVRAAEYENPKIFIATGVIVGLIVIGLVYIVYQYRKEIKQFILKVCRRNAS